MRTNMEIGKEPPSAAVSVGGGSFISAVLQYSDHQAADRDEEDADAVRESDFFLEDEDGEKDGEDDAELVDGGDARNVAGLQVHEVEEPGRGAGNAAQGNACQSAAIGEHLGQMSGMSLHDHDRDEEDCHDDAAHGGGGAAVEPSSPILPKVETKAADSAERSA